MNKLTVKFDEKLIKIDNPRCCNDGIVCSLNLENMTIGKNYLCEFSNIGPGTIFFRPQSVIVSANTSNKTIAFALELNGTRYGIVKASITNQDNPNDKAEDIISIECGQPTLFNIEFDPATLTIGDSDSCSDNKLIVAYIKDATIGKTYSYQFASPDQLNGSCQLIPSSGSIIAGDKTQNIGTIFKYTGINKVVALTLTVTDVSDNNVSRIETLIDCNSCDNVTIQALGADSNVQ